MQKIDWNKKIWTVFWVIISACFFCYLFIQAEIQMKHGRLAEDIRLIFIYFSQPQLFVVIFSLFLAAVLLNFVFNLLEEIKIQKIRNQPSWVYYIFLGLAIGPNLATAGLFIFMQGLNNPLSFIGLGVFNCSFSLVLILLLFFIREDRIDKNYRFASGSVSSEGDGLGFRHSAEHVARGLEKIDKYVSVVALYGELGFGKSSYARMIIENFNPDNILYTYISLTETNEAKDFSKLFAERWMETLKKRYPKIDTVLALPFMQSILRESGNNLLADMLSTVTPWLGKGLIRTKAKVCDEYCELKDGQKTSDEIAMLFGNIPDIKEDVWIVMVDEIERAQFDEAYRVVEIIERFKNEGRTGLPIKVLFLLCISNYDFSKLLSVFKDKDPRAYLINQFFYDDPKSINQILFLPPVDDDIKKKYIIDQIRKVIGSCDNLKLKAELGAANFDGISSPTQGFLSDDESLSFLLGLFLTSSPRVIARCMQGLLFFCTAFRNKAGKLVDINIRFSDLLAMEYAKIKYPYIINFFINSIWLPLVDYKETGGGLSSDGFRAYFQKEKLKKGNQRLADWIETSTGVSIREDMKNEVEDIVGLISYGYFNFLRKDQHTKDADLYYNSLALPENLYNYLFIISDKIVTPFNRYNKIYIKHKKEPADLSVLDLPVLLGYSHFISDVSSSSISIHMDVLREITKRILERKVNIELRNTGDTLYDNLILQFIFQLMEIVERDHRSLDSASDELSIAYDQLKNVLGSSMVTTGAKYMILNSLANNARGSGSMIHSRLNSVFSKFRKYWDEDVKKVISAVFAEADKKYYTNNLVIYENEENFFYTMYQGWSGRADAKNEIEKIRALASRNLVNYSDAINLYWDHYDFDEKWKNFDDVLRDGRFSRRSLNFELYMPLTTLLDITEESDIIFSNREISQKFNFWKDVHNNIQYKDLVKVKDDLGTLRAVLIKENLLLDI